MLKQYTLKDPLYFLKFEARPAVVIYTVFDNYGREDSRMKVARPVRSQPLRRDTSSQSFWTTRLFQSPVENLAEGPDFEGKLRASIVFFPKLDGDMNSPKSKASDRQSPINLRGYKRMRKCLSIRRDGLILLDIPRFLRL